MKGGCLQSSRLQNPLRCQGPRPADLKTSTILEHISEAVILIERRGHVCFINHAAGKITGHTKERALGQYCLDVVRARHLRAKVSTGWP